MFWANRIDKVTGVVLAALILLSIVGFVAGTPLGEVDPFARSDVEEMLRTINDNFGLWTASLVPFVVQDVLVVAMAALLYLAFRDRSHTLALVGAFAIVAGSMAAMMHEVGAMTLAFLAADFLGQGGPGVIAAGDPIILEAARTVSVSQALSALFAQTLLGVGVIAIGTLLIWSPAGQRNPPRWLGAAGLVGGLGMIGTWVFLVDHMAGGGLTLVAELAILVMLGGLAVWFLRRPAEDQATATPQESAA